MIRSDSDTIAAISTPPGQGGIAVVRISGKKSPIIADKLFSGKIVPSQAESHTVHLGMIRESGSENFMDQVLITVMRSPNSYTGEDVIEISSHGGQLLAQKILTACLEAGARMAQPGEFTQRAFLNGRLDLTQAEAVADLISARTDLGLRAAAEQLQGKLSDNISYLADKLKELTALVEAYIDFPDEDLGQDDRKKIDSGLTMLKKHLVRLVESYRHGRILKNGLKVPIVGRPNVGKSSLFNALLDQNRTIVTATPGTTRDTVSEYINISGLPVELIDTAGIRDSGDEVESEGIIRARAEIEKADLVLALVDLTDADILRDLDGLASALKGREYICLANKADLLDEDLRRARLISMAEYKPLPISAMTGYGLDQLKQVISSLGLKVNAESLKSGVIITSLRHRQALVQALDHILQVERGLKAESSYEFLAFDLRNALNSLEDIIGQTTPDEILERIFSRFCIGK